MERTKYEASVRERFNKLSPSLNERTKRLFVASEALAYGYGGARLVARATGVALNTIHSGKKELKKLEQASVVSVELQRVRQPGGGSKKSVDKDPNLQPALEGLIEPTTRGDPESPLRWTCKSLRNLSAELGNRGHKASIFLIAKLLKEMKYSLQGNKKTLEGSNHPDRNAQFEHINTKVQKQLADKNPVISVDTKKKELVGNFKNNGKELRPEGSPEEVQVHDFAGEQGKANPYGVYDIYNNNAWVSVGIDHDTGEFAVATIRRWWNNMGSELYPDAKSLLITADGGGSNGSRLRLWKMELQGLANELNIPISVSHLPPGTSKWNKIEHRLFSFITQNWLGKPLVTHQVIVNLIAATTTRTGLKVKCEIDDNKYNIGRKITDKELAAINIQRDDFHGEWNYTISPKEDQVI